MVLRGKFNGAKPSTEAMNLSIAGVVGERSARGEGRPEGRLEQAEVRMQA